MRITLALCCLSLAILSCNNGDKAPDVSGIRIELHTERFDQSLFTLDTLNLGAGLKALQGKYPSFTPNFLGTILNCDPGWTADTTAAYVRGFIGVYRQVYDTAQIVFRDFGPYEKEIAKALQYLKYYFPEYTAPKKLITYIGPLDGYGDIISDDEILIGLHQHLGAGFSLYKSTLVQETYPEYISRRFTPDYIAINCMKNAIDRLYPEKMEEKPLVQQMVEKGKRLYVLSKLVPKAEDYQLIGYTQEQMTGMYDHERAVWDLFVKNNFLQTIDNNIIKNYIAEGPKTQELGEAAPGNVGSFAGWQIVKKFMKEHPGYGLKKLMEANPETLFQEAKYKP